MLLPTIDTVPINLLHASLWASNFSKDVRHKAIHLPDCNKSHFPKLRGNSLFHKMSVDICGKFFFSILLNKIISFIASCCQWPCLYPNGNAEIYKGTTTKDIIHRVLLYLEGVSLLFLLLFLSLIFTCPHSL